MRRARPAFAARALTSDGLRSLRPADVESEVEIEPEVAIASDNGVEVLNGVANEVEVVNVVVNELGL